MSVASLARPTTTRLRDSGDIPTRYFDIVGIEDPFDFLADIAFYGSLWDMACRISDHVERNRSQPAMAADH